MHSDQRQAEAQERIAIALERLADAFAPKSPTLVNRTQVLAKSPPSGQPSGPPLEGGEPVVIPPEIAEQLKRAGLMDEEQHAGHEQVLRERRGRASRQP